MDNKQFNKQRHNRKKQQYRFFLGIQQLINYPILNLVWIVLLVGAELIKTGAKELVGNMEVYSI